MDHLLVNLMAWVIAPVLMIYIVWHYFRIKKAATYLSNDEFKALLRTGQLIDIRDPGQFRRRHILGARNFPVAQLQSYLSALRQDKPILVYDNTRAQQIGRAVLTLKKAGFTQVYVLKDGLDYWDGKTKSN